MGHWCVKIEAYVTFLAGDDLFRDLSCHMIHLNYIVNDFPPTTAAAEWDALRWRIVSHWFVMEWFVSDVTPKRKTEITKYYF